jgi:hypothetical protein
MEDSQRSGDLILVKKRENGIACITINRPKSMNSLTKSMITDLAEAFKSLNGDTLVKVIIITGAGRAFCSGVVFFSCHFCVCSIGFYVGRPQSIYTHVLCFLRLVYRI